MQTDSCSFQHKEHIFSAQTCSQTQRGSWDKKPRKQGKMAFRGDSTTCNLHLSQNLYESAAKCAGREHRQPLETTGCRTKRKPKYFLSTSSVLKNEGKQRPGAAARVYTLTTMNKTRGDSGLSWVAPNEKGDLKPRFEKKKKKTPFFGLNKTMCHQIRGNCFFFVHQAKLEKTCKRCANLPELHLQNLTQIPISPSVSRELGFISSTWRPLTFSMLRFISGRGFKREALNFCDFMGFFLR